jgi:AbiJ N-terminal domain 4
MFENVFSRRKGYTAPPIQGNRKELSFHARNRLWDVFYIGIYRPNQFNDLDGSLGLLRPLKAFFRSVWTELYHGRIDEYPGSELFLVTLKNDFLSGLWYFPFDIFEAIFENWKELMGDPDEVASRIRNALERENQAYTFVGSRFVERMAPQESFHWLGCFSVALFSVNIQCDLWI